MPPPTWLGLTITSSVRTNDGRDRCEPPKQSAASRSNKSGKAAHPRSEASGRLWHRASLRGQILAAFILVNLVAGVVAAMVVIYDARRAAQEEIAASMHLAERLVREAVERGSTDTHGTALFRNLGLELGHLRHVRILFADTNGSLASLLPVEPGSVSADGEARVPDWFTALVHVSDVRREIRIVLDGQQIGSAPGKAANKSARGRL